MPVTIANGKIHCASRRFANSYRSETIWTAASFGQTVVSSLATKRVG